MRHRTAFQSPTPTLRGHPANAGGAKSQFAKRTNTNPCSGIRTAKAAHPKPWMQYAFAVVFKGYAAKKATNTNEAPTATANRREVL
tara:strand:- start:1165 stop:1422 length:258 start_codon:yes stop_codon:yes gene_type:complete